VRASTTLPLSRHHDRSNCFFSCHARATGNDNYSLVASFASARPDPSSKRRGHGFDPEKSAKPTPTYTSATAGPLSWLPATNHNPSRWPCVPTHATTGPPPPSGCEFRLAKTATTMPSGRGLWLAYPPGPPAVVCPAHTANNPN